MLRRLDEAGLELAELSVRLPTLDVAFLAITDRAAEGSVMRP
jgi:hypothetical protein